MNSIYNIVNWHLAQQTVIHHWAAGYWRGHHVHSPFVYHIVRHVITTRHIDRLLRDKASRYRTEIKANKTMVEVTDFGTGSGREPMRRVSDIARRTSIDSKYGMLLARIAQDLKPQNVVELGTSLGMSTFYLAYGAPQANIYTIEGSANISRIASECLTRHGVTNVEFITGNFDDELPHLMERIESADLVYIDGNHTYEATMRYFNLLADRLKPISAIVFDDIHWSAEMTRAWNDIVADPRVMSSIDVLHTGIVYFRTGCQKEHFKVRW